MATTTPCGRAITAVPTASGEIRRAAGGQTPCSRVAPSTTSASGSTCRCASSRPMHTPHAFARSMLTAAPRPSVAGHCAGASWSPRTCRISSWAAWEALSNDVGVGGGPREAVAPDRGHCVLRLCSARMAPRCCGACFWLVARVGGRLCMQHWLGPSCRMSMGGVCVKTPVQVRSFSALTPPCNTWSYFS